MHFLTVKSTAIGADGISISILLYSCPIILPYLTHIFNHCLKFNVIPKIWKLAQVISIPKKSNPEDVGDLRPISILCTPSKVFEMILDARMRDFVAKNDILPENQSEFRSGHSCTTALLKVTDDIRKYIDDGNLCILILLDFSKAFDKLNHDLRLLFFATWVFLKVRFIY
ncbi:unnamed protein product [Acanthoscelides obtectus]|uniref:Reverse transcriptase domain-containing protein n=1 Tax=Acanthoscelides obtectus TaxID=200917 RepID=A0A9P0L7H2_ACAOB|nr:unnamed protein product [Acanthoscelides obtectus]CAK1663263.1 Probable RNA-directed DNA polymerase from transposon BS [Acanthoscelides obtectus]